MEPRELEHRFFRAAIELSEIGAKLFFQHFQHERPSSRQIFERAEHNSERAMLVPNTMFVKQCFENQMDTERVQMFAMELKNPIFSLERMDIEEHQTLFNLSVFA